MEISRELLDETQDDDLWCTIVEFVKDYLSDFDDHDYDQAFLRLPKGMQMTWHVAGIEFEVPNGGFSQFFYNSTGTFAQETLEALRAFGATNRADVLQQAIELYQKAVGRPTTYRERWRGAMCELPEMDELDRRYWTLTDEEDLSGGFAAYIKKHIEEFLCSTVL